MKPDSLQEVSSRVVSLVAELLGADASILIVSGRATAAHNLKPTTSWQRQLVEASSTSAQPFEWHLPEGTRLADGREAGRAIALQLRVAAEPLGFLAVLRAEGRGTFGPEDLGRLRALGPLLGPTFQAHLSTEVTTAVLSALAEACRATGTQELLEKAVEGTVRALGGSGGSVMLLNEKGELVVRAARGLPQDVVEGIRQPVGEGIAGYVARSGEPVLLTGPVRDPRFKGVDPGIDGAISVPLRGSRGVLGVLNVRRKAVGAPFDLGDLRLALTLAQGLAGALERAREAVEANEDRRHAVALFELGRLVQRMGDESESLRGALTMACDYLGARAGLIAQKLGDDQWNVLASHGFADREEDAPRAIEQLLREARATSADGTATLGASVPWRNDGTVYLGVSLEVGDVSGALVLGRDEARPFTINDISLADAVGMQISGLWEQLIARRDEGTRLIAEERQRIAHDLHDGLAQELSGVLLAIEGTQLALAQDPEAARRQLAKAIRSTRECLRDVRRYLTMLRWDDGLQEGTARQLEHVVAEAMRQGLPVELRADGKGPALPRDVQRTVLRVAREALTNAHKHSRARKVEVVLTQRDQVVLLSVEDDGAGFAVLDTMKRAPAEGRYGLVGMRERAESVGGRLEIASVPGRGTRLELMVPLVRSREGAGVSGPPREEGQVLAREMAAPPDTDSVEADDGEVRPKSLFRRLPTLLKR
ncbi:MAG: GAF domain-containing sensor histidine kinase [Chloroflexi bacterium]|nr:GAF domain-containing sensor histidine kinase [Chloroflexota bacterium]